MKFEKSFFSIFIGLLFPDESTTATAPDSAGVYSIPMPYDEIHNSLPISSIFGNHQNDGQLPSYDEAIASVTSPASWLLLKSIAVKTSKYFFNVFCFDEISINYPINKLRI